jgi:hypothetical protein
VVFDQTKIYQILLLASIVSPVTFLFFGAWLAGAFKPQMIDFPLFSGLIYCPDVREIQLIGVLNVSYLVVTYLCYIALLTTLVLGLTRLCVFYGFFGARATVGALVELELYRLEQHQPLYLSSG